MGIFQQFPYSNFHEMNLDQLIKIMREMQDEWADTKAEWASYKDFIDNYFANLNLDAETEKALRALVADGTLDPVIDPVIIAETQAWLADHITQPTTPAIDTSLTIAGAAADAKATGDAIDLMEHMIFPYNAVDLLYPAALHYDQLDKGITFTHNGNRCSLSGTAVGQAYNNIYADRTVFPNGIVPGDTYDFMINSTVSAASIVVFFYNSSLTLIQTLRFRDRGALTIPAAAAGMIMRIEVDNGATVSGYIEYGILTTLSNAELYDYVNNNAVIARDFLATNTDVNTILSGSYGLSDARVYTNIPADMNGLAGTLVAVKISDNYVMQICTAFLTTQTKVYRRYMLFNNWYGWAEIGGGGSGTTNEYNFYTNSNTYNVTSSPVITSDTNNFLHSSNDTTDRTSDIVTMLTANKVCRLGTGVFYVKDLQMPVNTAIIGSGTSTKIIMAAGSGCAIQMNDYCIVEDCAILGSATDITVPVAVGDRHGILWAGDYTLTHDSTTQPKMGLISNVLIANFTGGAITCQNTGYATFNQLEVVNAFIRYCGVGINISYLSEYHKFTNIKTVYCLYGCINNGGNNMFVNCDFSACTNGVLLDNSSNQSPNNSHGSMIGCSFNHTDNNTGVGIEVLNCPNGFIFDGCQIFYSQINVEDSDGIVFSNCNFGVSNCNITIDGGHVVLFANNMHQGMPTISITGNTNTHFVNCYNRNTGAVITN